MSVHPSTTQSRTAPNLVQSAALGLGILAAASLVTTTTLTEAQFQFPEVPGATPVFGGFVVSPLDPLTIEEETTGQMDVVLINGPSQPATITVTPSDPSLVTVSPSTLTFDENNWSILQPVQVTSLADTNTSTDMVTLDFQISTASPEFVGMEVQTRTVMITDAGNQNGNNGNGNSNNGNGNNGNGNGNNGNNGNGNNGNGNGNGGGRGGSNPDDDNNNAATEAGMTITPETMLSVNEGEVLTGAYDIILNSDPGQTVTIKVDSNNPNSLTVNGQGRTEVVFDSSDWNQSKQISVEGVEDDNVNDEQVNITFDVLNGPNAYLNLANQSRQVMTMDNDGQTNEGDSADDDNGNDDNEEMSAGLVINPVDPVTMDEGTTEEGVYAVSLESMPSEAVTVEVRSNDPARLVMSTSASAQMTFDASNWDQPQLLTLTALEDEDTFENFAPLTFEVVSGPSAYTDLDFMFRSVRILDNDTDTGVGGSNPDDDNNDATEQGLMVTPADPIAIFEGESVPGAFDVALMSRPTGPVTVMVQSNTPESLAINADNMLALTFDATNWDQLQQIDIEGVEDENTEDEIAFLSFDTSGANYDDVDNVLRSVNVFDNDSATDDDGNNGDDNGDGGFGGANPDDDNNDAGDDMNGGDDMETPDTGFGGANPDADNNDADNMDNTPTATGGTATPKTTKKAGAKGLIRTGGASDLSAYALIALGTLLLAGSFGARALSRVRRD